MATENMLQRFSCISLFKPPWTEGGQKILRTFHFELQTKSWCLINIFLQKVQIFPKSPFSLLTYSDKHKYAQKASKTKQSLSKNNQSSKEMRLQSFGEYIFFAFQKFYGKITFHDFPFIFKALLDGKLFVKLFLK